MEGQKVQRARPINWIQFRGSRERDKEAQLEWTPSVRPDGTDRVRECESASWLSRVPWHVLVTRIEIHRSAIGATPSHPLVWYLGTHTGLMAVGPTARRHGPEGRGDSVVVTRSSFRIVSGHYCLLPRSCRSNHQPLLHHACSSAQPNFGTRMQAFGARNARPCILRCGRNAQRSCYPSLRTYCLHLPSAR